MAIRSSITHPAATRCCMSGRDAFVPTVVHSRGARLGGSTFALGEQNVEVPSAQS